MTLAIRPRELLDQTLDKLCKFVWDRNSVSWPSLWSIPADRERDWDFILKDALTELYARRDAMEAAGLELPTDGTRSRTDWGRA